MCMPLDFINWATASLLLALLQFIVYYAPWAHSLDEGTSSLTWEHPPTVFSLRVPGDLLGVGL